MFKKVLYPIDLQEGDLCRQAIPQVVEQVRGWNAVLYLMHVVPGFGMPLVESYFPADARKKLAKQARKEMRTYIAESIPDDISVIPIVCEGIPYEQILREASEQGVELIIIPSHDRRGVARFLLGSTASKVVRHAHCSVLVLRNC